MKNKLLIIMTAFAFVFSSLTLSSCSKKVNDSIEENQRATTIEAVEITDIPAQKKDIVKLFNQSLDNVRIYKNSYTKSVIREITDIDVDTLSVVSKSKSAFKSVFGKTDTKNIFDYSKSKEKFLSNLPNGKITENDIISASAELNDNTIYITLELATGKNPANDSSIFKLCDSFMTVDLINSSMKKFNIESEVTSVVSDNITVIAKIDKLTSDLMSYSVSFKESFNLIDVTLEEITGKDVTAKAEAEVIYNNFN